MAHLLRCEKETVINFNDEDNNAVISTSQDWMKNRLHKLAEKNPDDVKIRHENGSTLIVELPKRWVSSVRPPRKVSEEQRKASAERLKAYREKKMENITK